MAEYKEKSVSSRLLKPSLNYASQFVFDFDWSDYEGLLMSNFWIVTNITFEVFSLIDEVFGEEAEESPLRESNIQIEYQFDVNDFTGTFYESGSLINSKPYGIGVRADYKVKVMDLDAMNDLFIFGNGYQQDLLPPHFAFWNYKIFIESSTLKTDLYYVVRDLDVYFNNQP